jgi:AcrR family transcriptional regulator
VNAPTKGRGRPLAVPESTARERIIDAARRVFSEVGYEAATYQAIAERAGLTRPAVNYHFREKRLLYREVVEQTTARLVRAAMRKAMDHTSLMEQLEALMALVIDAESKDHAAAAFLATSFLELQRHPELRSEDDGVADIRVFLTTVINGAIVRGELPADPDVPAMVDTLLVILWGIGFYAGFVATQAQLAGVMQQLRQLLGRALTGAR